MSDRLCVYDNAQHVRYLYGQPIPFDPSDTERHETNWVKARREWEARKARRREGVRD